MLCATFFFSSPTPQLNFALTDTNCPNVHFAVEVQLFSASESFRGEDSPPNIVSYFLFSNFFAVDIVKISPWPFFPVLSPDPFHYYYYYHYYYYDALNDS